MRYRGKYRTRFEYDIHFYQYITRKKARKIVVTRLVKIEVREILETNCRLSLQKNAVRES